MSKNTVDDKLVEVIQKLLQLEEKDREIILRIIQKHHKKKYL
jgi:hypothetical protein